MNQIILPSNVFQDDTPAAVKEWFAQMGLVVRSYPNTHPEPHVDVVILPMVGNNPDAVANSTSIAFRIFKRKLGKFGSIHLRNVIDLEAH